eukprot:scaffold93041_cov61-Phaeocystis_antarctica.AAC.1
MSQAGPKPVPAPRTHPEVWCGLRHGFPPAVPATQAPFRAPDKVCGAGCTGQSGSERLGVTRHVHVHGHAYVAEFLGQGQGRSRLNHGSSYSLGLRGAGQLVPGRSRSVLVSGALGVSGGARVPLDVSKFRIGGG